MIQRYIGCLTGRIDGMGGNASRIPASPNGYQLPSGGHGHGHGHEPGHGHGHGGEHCHVHEHCHQCCCTGKVIGIRYNRFGDFVGFDLLSVQGHEHFYRGREEEVEELVKRAWIDRTLLSVHVEAHEPDWPASIVLRRPN